MSNVDKSVLTLSGSMNYIVQLWTDEDGMVLVDQYQPRHNYVWQGKISKDEAREQVKETIERMKIATVLMQEWLDGKREKVYFWQEDGEDGDGYFAKE